MNERIKGPSVEALTVALEILDKNNQWLSVDLGPLLNASIQERLAQVPVFRLVVYGQFVPPSVVPQAGEPLQENPVRSDATKP
jgi:hypothetical protein